MSTAAKSELYEAVLKGDVNRANAITLEEIGKGVDPLVLVNEHMAPAMDEVGRLFETHEYFIPELLLSARAMKAAMQHLRPIMLERKAESRGKIVIGTVQGDLHDIGKNLVATMLEGAGYEIIDLGVDVKPDAFVAAVRENGAPIVALSALLTTTMTSMKSTIEAFRAAGLRDGVKVIVGGAPVTADYAQQIGADGFGESAVEAVGLVRRLH